MIKISIFQAIFSKNQYRKAETITINVTPDIYYKELALYTVSSLIGNAISRSEFQCFQNNEMTKNEDYYKLNVTPNGNETSSIFWHKVINKVIRNGESLVVETNDGCLYCAENYTTNRRAIIGDYYTGVTLKEFTFKRSFDKNNTYMFRLNNINASVLLSGLHEEWSKLLSAAKNDFIKSHSNRYKIKIDGVRAGDKNFNEEFENIIQEQVKEYFKNDDAVYPEYEGYELVQDESTKNKYSADDFLKLRKEYFEIAAGTYHIPLSMMTGNITNMKEIVSSFLSFAVDPFADMITEALNKGVGFDNFAKGIYYKVDTSYNNHTDIFQEAQAISNLISSGYYCIDEVRIKRGDPPLNTWWSRTHFMTKNFASIDSMCTTLADEGGEINEE